MLRMTPSCQVYLALGPTDLRNNIDGLLLKIKYQFRLDSGTFNWPAKADGKNTLPVTEQQLSWLLDGLNIEQTDAHPEVLARKII